MENNSIWQINSKGKSNKEIITDSDILIIGGGITGLSAAYFLKDSKYTITVIDRGIIGNGITSKSTAKITYLQNIIYQTLEKSFNRTVSNQYLKSQLDAINLLTGIIEKENIKCDLKETKAIIFTKEDKGINKIDKEKSILEANSISCKVIDKLPIHFPIKYGIEVDGNYTFHPVKYLLGLKKVINKNVNIYENTMALGIKKNNDIYIVKTNKSEFRAKYIIVSCHYPFFIFPGIVPLKTYIQREYVNASKYKNYNFMANSIDSNLHSIRFYKNYIIYGSNKHRLTNKIAYKDNYIQSVINFKRLFSKNPEYTWMNQDIMSNDNLPFIGKIDKDDDNLLIATAYSAWGMTNGTMAGKILSDIILDNKNNYISLFDPTRVNKTGIFNSIIDAINYSKVYIQTTVKKNPVFYNNYVYKIKVNGNYYGVYYDYYGKKHVVKGKCPHMKCNLVFNDEEKTWDCPCHGSRFDIDGNVIEGPANYNISTDFNNIEEK